MRSNHEYEERVMHFLTENKRTTIIPQIELNDGNNNKTSYSPDFVAVRHDKKAAYVVEVSVAGSPGRLAGKMTTTNLEDIRKFLQAAEILSGDWSLQFVAFVKSDSISRLEKHLKKASSELAVHIWPIEVTLAHWLWTKDVRNGAFDLARPDMLKYYVTDSSCIKWNFPPGPDEEAKTPGVTIQKS